MDQPDDIPRGERPQVDVRLLRARDLIDLRLEAPGCTIEPTGGGAELVAGPNASLLVHFPPQHLGEEVWQFDAAPPTLPSRHVAAGPTRLVHEVPDGTRIAYRMEDVLEALKRLRLRVSPNATAAGEAPQVARSPEKPTDLET